MKVKHGWNGKSKEIQRPFELKYDAYLVLLLKIFVETTSSDIIQIILTFY